MMKHHKVMVLGKIYNVTEMEFDDVTGELIRIDYKANEYQKQTIFKSDEMIDKTLKSSYKIKSITKHPFHNYFHAPNLDELLL